MSSDTLHDIVLHERIGEGGIADVFRGEWRGRMIAVKVLREPERRGLRKRFIREGRLLQRLSDPGLVRCLDVRDGAQPILLLELLVGHSVDVYVRQGPLAPDTVVALASGALRALAFLHDHGIVHRDVKASNLWLGLDGRIVLVDLGLAADVSDPLTTTLGDVLGTHAYMAPEQIAGAETDHRCDLYSLGVTLYEALCGARPYLATGLAGYLQAHRAAGALPIVERIPNAPVRLAALIDRLMARDPAARPPSANVALAWLTGNTPERRALAPARMVGRAAATGALQAVLDAGGVLRISGELGSGLGSVARHALALARADGIEHARIGCRPRAGREVVLAELARELSQLGDRVSPDLPAVMDAIAASVGEDGRFLVLAEDLDLAPEGVAELFERLAGVPGVTIVVTGRALPELPQGRDLGLRPLSLGEVGEQLASMFGTPTLPAGFDVAVMAATSGLPALVSAVVREQVERGTVWCDGVGEDGRMRWAWDQSGELLPGEDMQRVYDRALRRLPAEGMSLVQALAVAAEPVPMDLLLGAVGAEPSGIALGAAVTRGIVEVRVVGGEEWVSLRRSVFGPIVLGAMSEEEQQALHLAVADAVRIRPIREWEQRFLLLHLALGARDPEDTARLIELGDWLVTGGRPLRGLAVLEAASRLPIDSGDTLALLALSRSDALVQVGRLAEARVALDVGRSLAELSEVEEIRSRAMLTHAELALAFGRHIPDDARRMLDHEPHLPPRALLLDGLVLREAGALGEAAERFGAAAEGAAPGPADRVGVAARLGFAGVVAEQGDLRRAALLYRGLAAELRSVERPAAASEALVRLADVSLRQGRVRAALDALGTAQALVEGQVLSWGPASVALVRASVHLAMDDIEPAAAVLVAHAACADPASPRPLRAYFLSLQAEVREAAGDHPAALAAHVRAAADASAAGDVLDYELHAGMIAILSADAEAVGNAVHALASREAVGRLARLLLLGGLVGRDAEILEAAEAEARAAQDRLLLLRVLHARGDARGRSEARKICTSALEGVFGRLRERFELSAPARWASGGRGDGRHDTGG